MGFFKKKSDDNKPGVKREEKKKELHVLCPSCFLDFTVEAVEEAGGVCPSCKAKIDLSKLPRAVL